MTRALELLARGEVTASLAMHPLAAPVLVVDAALGLALLLATLRSGTPLGIVRARSGKCVLVATAIVYAGLAALYALRAAGLFGGPVPIE